MKYQTTPLPKLESVNTICDLYFMGCWLHL